MIVKKYVLENIQNTKDEYRDDTEIGVKCRDSVNSILEFVKNLPKHRDTDLIIDTSLYECEVLLREINLRQKCDQERLLNKVYTVIEQSVDNEKIIYYIENEDTVPNFIKSLISKCDIDEIGTTSYKSNVIYLTDEEYLKIIWEKI